MGNNLKNQRIVSNVNLEMYMGKWYEIARNPAFFEDANAKNVTAEYTLEGDKVRVVNTEQVGNKIKSKAGYATVQNPGKNSKLKVQFDGVPFAGDYWIVRLGDVKNGQYQWAIVSEPSGQYIWFLSRTKQFEYLDYFRNELTQEGYDLSKLIITPQE